MRHQGVVARIAAGEAVLRELLPNRPGHEKQHIALAATHDGELVDLREP